MKIRAASPRALFRARSSEDNLWAAWYSYRMPRRRRTRTLRSRAHLRRRRSPKRVPGVSATRPGRDARGRSRAAGDLQEILKFQGQSSAVIKKVRLTNASEPAFVFTALFVKP